MALIPIAVIGMIVYFFSDIVTYVITAWVISMIGAPMVTFFRKYMGNSAAAALTLMSFLMVFMLLLYIFIPNIVTQAKYLTSVDYQRVVHSIEEPLEDWRNWLLEKKLLPSDTISVVPKVEAPDTSKYMIEKVISLDSHMEKEDSTWVHTNVNINIRIDASDFLPKTDTVNTATPEVTPDFFERLKTSLVHYLSPRTIQSIFSSTVNAFGNIAIGLMSVLFISFFFLKEQGLFYNAVKAAVPRGYEEQATHAIDETSHLLIRYFIGIVIQITIITIFVSTALYLLDIKNAMLIAFFAAIMNVIPYLGPIFGLMFGVVITISSNLSVPFYDVLVPQLIRVVSVFAVMQLIDNFILQPNIFSKSVKAHPLEIFLVVLIGAKIGGVLGMVLAIPFYTAFRVVGKVFLSEFKVIQFITKNM